MIERIVIVEVTEEIPFSIGRYLEGCDGVLVERSRCGGYPKSCGQSPHEAARRVAS